MSRYMDALIKKHGSEEKAREAIRANASKGGKAKVAKGFAMMSPEKLKEITSKGGHSSWGKRSKK